MREFYFPVTETVTLHAFPALLAVASPSDPNPLMVLINYGALGIIVILYVTGMIPSKGEVKLLKEQNTEYRTIIDRFQTVISTSTLPALQRQAQVLEAIPNREYDYLGDLKDSQAKMVELLARMESISKGGEAGKNV